MSLAGCQNNPIVVNFYLQKSWDHFEKKISWQNLIQQVFQPIVKLQRIGWLSWMIYIGRFQGKPLTVQIRDNGLYNIIHPGKLLSVKNYVLRGFGTILKLHICNRYILAFWIQNLVQASGCMCVCSSLSRD